MKSLQEIRRFSARERCDPFTASFDLALETVSSQGLKLHGYHKDLSPAGFLPEHAAAVLDAAQTSWVFGGMGSWNDMGFEGDAKKEFERVSEDLFQTLNFAIIAAANTSAALALRMGTRQQATETADATTSRLTEKRLAPDA